MSWLKPRGRPGLAMPSPGLASSSLFGTQSPASAEAAGFEPARERRRRAGGVPFGDSSGGSLFRAPNRGSAFGGLAAAGASSSAAPTDLLESERQQIDQRREIKLQREQLPVVGPRAGPSSNAPELSRCAEALDTAMCAKGL